MVRILLVLIVIVVGVGAYLWFGSQSLPDWYQNQAGEERSRIEALVNRIEDQGTAKFLGDKFADVLQGSVVLDEEEFNALLLASLKRHEDGRRLLQVSDVVRAELRQDEIELAAIIDLNKVRQLEPRARKALENVRGLLPFSLDDKVFVAVKAQPVARNGGLGVSEEVSLQLGAVPISAAFLKRSGVPLDRLELESIPLKNLTIQAVEAREDQLRLIVLPKF